MAVFGRSIFDSARPERGWFTPLMPVREAVTKSVRGTLVGVVPRLARALSSSAGSVGWVT